MRIVLSIFIVHLSLSLLSISNTKADDDAKLIVYEVEAVRASFSDVYLKKLHDKLKRSVSILRIYNVVSDSDVRRAMKKSLGRSDSTCFSRNCQYTVASELSADKLIATQVVQIRDRCRIDIAICDAETARCDNRSSLEAECLEKSLLSAVVELVDMLFRRIEKNRIVNNLNKEAVILHKKGKYHEAIELYSRILRYDPDNCKSLLGMGIIYAKIGRKDEGEKAYKKFRETCPEHSPGKIK